MHEANAILGFSAAWWTVLFGLLFALALACFFPIRNTVTYRGRPWATWGLIAVNVAAWLAPILDRLFSGSYGLSAGLSQFIFRDDFSRPWTLVTCQFVHAGGALPLLVGLWLFYLIAPALEQQLKPYGLLGLYVVGGAAVAALYGALSMSAGARIVLAGMSPGFYVLLGLYFVAYPFEEIVFAYNLLFFTFCGTIRVATFFLVLFAVAIHVVSGLIVGGMILGLAPAKAAGIAWLDESVPLLGLVVGFLVGVLKFGLGAFVGKSPVAESRSPADRMVERALARMTHEKGPGSARPPSRRERSQSQQALADEAPAEEIEAFAEQCLRTERDPLLEAAFARFRSRFPDRCFGPGLQAEMARRFERTNRLDLAADAYRILVKSYGETPVGSEARLELARLLVNDPTAVEEATELLDDLLKRNPRREAADEARRLLELLMERSGRDQTYTGLGPHKPFRFSKPPGHSRPLATPAGVPSQPDGQPIGRSAEELIGEPDSAVAAEAAKEAREEAGVDGPVVSIESVKQDIFTAHERAEEPAFGRKAAAPAPPPLRTQEIVPDSADETLSEWGLRLAEVSETTAAMAAARSFAVILLPSRLLVVDKARTVLSEFWAVSREEAAERLRRCRGVLLDDAPSGRSVVLARRLRSMGLSVTVVPLLPDLVYSGGEDVFEFAFSDSACGTVTSSGRKSFGWDQVRLVNAARVGLPGAGAAYRLVLELFVAQPQRLLRIWETTVNFARSGLGGKMGAAQSLQSVIEYLDARTPRALKTPSFRAMAKKSGPPLDFHSPAELEHYNRWFLYAGFGKYAASDL